MSGGNVVAKQTDSAWTDHNGDTRKIPEKKYSFNYAYSSHSFKLFGTLPSLSTVIKLGTWAWMEYRCKHVLTELHVWPMYCFFTYCMKLHKYCSWQGVLTPQGLMTRGRCSGMFFPGIRHVTAFFYRQQEGSKHSFLEMMLVFTKSCF